MRALSLVVCLALVGPAMADEKLFGSNVDVRTAINLKVSEAAVQKLAPEGWEAVPFTAEPAKGANLNITLIDSIIAQDGEGKATTPFRGMVLAIAAKKKGADAPVPMVVWGIALPELVPGAYGVYVLGKSTIERRSRTDTDNKTIGDETWLFASDDGNSLTVELEYELETTARSKVEAKIYAKAKPELFHIYRVEQVSAVVRNAELNRASKFSLKGAGPQLSWLFDGTEQLVSVVVVPFYSRQIFLPGS